ncbi:MAG: hypothetical protein EBV86_15140, partial [Marivivens sp.]|nr:hypothetical protein [Marivivens sp.]
MKYVPIDSVSVPSFTVRQVSSAGVRVYQRVFKRIIDTMLVAVSLPIVVPVIAVLALIIRRDGGPAFFVQPRVGLNGHVFPCFKLRTMHVDAEARLAEMCAADPIIAAEWHRDQKLRTLRLEIHSVPTEIASKQKLIADSATRLETARSRAKTIEVEKKSLQIDTAAKRDQIAKYKNQQLQTRKNEEYTALAHEIANVEKLISQIEDKELLLM